MKKKTSILFLFLLIVSLNNCNSQTNSKKQFTQLIKDNYHLNINEFIQNKLIDNRIVAIGDQGHGNHLYMKTITDYLNYWIESLSKFKNKGQNIPRDLYLILEADSTFINAINKYFLTDNPYYLLDPTFIFGNQYTTAYFEFFYDLRLIKNKVDLLNQKLSSENKISFRLFGPEKIIDLTNWTIEKRDTFFVYERDRYSSQQIIELLKNDSAAKALIFYGAGHLIENKTQKLQNISVQSYFLGHYLYEFFNDKGGYYTIGQISTDTNPQLSEYYKCSDRNYVIENSIFNGYTLPINMQPQFEDASIILFDKNFVQPHFSQVWSQNNIDCFLNNYEKFLNLKNRIDLGIIGRWLMYLYTISERAVEIIDYNDSTAIISAINHWKLWRKNEQMNYANEIINQNILKERIKLLANSKYPFSQEYERELQQMFYSNVFYNKDASPSEMANAFSSFVEKNKKAIITDELINLLWIGTNDENQKALEYLKNTYSINLNTAKEWTNWWRHLNTSSN
jgi:hypothetical protein